MTPFPLTKLNASYISTTEDDPDEMLPALYKAADQEAIRAQKNYSALLKTDLILLGAAAFVSSFSIDRTAHSLYGNISAGTKVGCLILSFIVSLIIRFKGIERQWYESRFVAESIKSLAWRCLSGVPLFSTDKLLAIKSNTDAQGNSVLVSSNHEFDKAVEALLDKAKEVQSIIAPKAVMRTDDRFNSKLKELEGNHFDKRKQLYLSNRLENQLKWYAKKAESNHRKKETSFYMVILCQLCAVVFAIVTWLVPHQWNIGRITTEITPTGFLTSLAAAIFAWTQFKQHQQLANRYGMATAKLSILTTLGKEANDQTSFAVVVEEVEQCLSNEHQEWYDKRTAN